MRVLHVVSSLGIGGAERLVVDLAAAQLRAGLAVWIIDLGRDEQPLGASARKLGVRVIRVGRFRSRFARAASLLATRLAAREHVLHIHNPSALRAVLPSLPALRGRVIYTRHGPSPYNHRRWRIVHRLARDYIDHVTFVTDEARGAFEAVHGAGSHLVVENGVAIVPAAPRDAFVGGRLRIGTVGRLVELKGQWRVLDAVAALPPEARARVEVHLFGDGPERERLNEHARDRLPGVPVVFHGTVLDRNRIYASIDVLVMASRTEGQSMAIMEAMARAVPVIATNVGGNAGLVRDGETGLLVPANNAEAIRDALARLLADPALVHRFGRSGQARIAAHHSIDTVAAKYRALYARP